MNFYLVSCDGDDMPEEPMMAAGYMQAVDLYVRASLEGHTGASLSDLRRALCINVSQFEAPEGGVGLMKDSLGTMVPMRSIPSWQAYLTPSAEANETPGGPD